MANKLIPIITIFAAVALAGALSLTFVAGDADADTGAGGEVERGSFLQRLHQMGQSLHGGNHHQDSMARLIDQLELTPEQLRHFEKVLEFMGSRGNGGHASMAELHEQLVAQFEQGRIETDEIRQIIDEHVEQIRTMAYGVTDELIALVNGLDARQRDILLEHLQENDGDSHGAGHGHG